MNDWNAELFIKLYSKMSLALGVTPVPDDADPAMRELVSGPLPARNGVMFAGQDAATATGKQESLICIANPGAYLPATLDPENKVEDRASLSALFDNSPQFSWFYKAALWKVAQAYSSVLVNKEAPLTKLTADQKEKLTQSQAVLDEDWAIYSTYQDAYWDQLDAYNAALATYMNDKEATIPPSLERRVKAALDAWNALGRKSKVESALAIVTALGALEPELFWSKLSERYTAATQQTSQKDEFQPVGVFPPYKSWFQDAGWTSFSFTQKDMNNQSSSQAIAVSGKLDGDFGMFRVSGSGKYEEDKTYVKMEQTELDVSCKLLRVSLDRPWMNPLIFGSRAWRFYAGGPMGGQELSSGADIEAGISPTGKMIAIPTAAILSKDVSIKGSFDNTIVEEMHREIDAEASVGIGPFAVAGQFAMTDDKKTVKGSVAADVITAKDVQVIGWICQLLPKCPDPNNDLPWPN
jgi:hypothetical protein